MWQRVIWTSQICGPVFYSFTRTKPLVLTKIQVIDIAFSLRTQAVEIQRLTTNDKSTALANHPSSWGGSKAEPQFTSMAKPFKDGVDQGRRVVPSGKDQPFRWCQHHSDLGLWNQPYLYPSLCI